MIGFTVKRVCAKKQILMDSVVVSNAYRVRVGLCTGQWGCKYMGWRSLGRLVSDGAEELKRLLWKSLEEYVQQWTF